MKLESSTVAGSRAFLIVGWIFSAIPILMMGLAGLITSIVKPEMVADGMAQHGYPRHLAAVILTLEISCAVIYAIPQTAALGAILLTGYLGGAIATHVRVEETQWVAAAVFGAFVWLGLYFRDKRVRALIPLRK